MLSTETTGDQVYGLGSLIRSAAIATCELDHDQALQSGLKVHINGLPKALMGLDESELGQPVLI